MEPAWSAQEELRIFRHAVRGFLATEFVPRLDAWRAQGIVDRQAWTAAGAMGLLLTEHDPDLGGGGGSFATEAIVYEELARIGDTSFCKGVHECCAGYIRAYGTPEQRRRWLPDLAAGRRIGAIAMTEPGNGSDLKAVRTTARPQGDHYLVSGSKTFISNGASADLILLVATVDPAAGAKGVTLLVLETDDLPGFRRGRRLAKMGQCGQDTSELFFDDMIVPATNRLGAADGLGFGQLMSQLAYERLIIAVQAVTFAERALALAVDHAMTRETFGRPLVDHQALRFALADARTEAHTGRVLVNDCIARIIEGRLDAETAAMAKLWTTEMQGRVVDACLQVFGGAGYMAEHPLAQMYVDARAQRIYAGSNEVMKEIVARGLATLKGSPQ